MKTKAVKEEKPAEPAPAKPEPAEGPAACIKTKGADRAWPSPPQGSLPVSAMNGDTISKTKFGVGHPSSARRCDLRRIVASARREVRASDQARTRK